MMGICTPPTRIQRHWVDQRSQAALEKQLASETDAREAAEGKVAAALEALQAGDAPPAKPALERPVSEAATRPMPTPAAPAPRAVVEEKPAPVKPPAPKPVTAPGRFSFLKK